MRSRRSHTLTDQHGRTHTYLRLAVTDRCNLRCRYCAPAGLRWRDEADLLADDEVFRAARLFAGLGIRKIRLTGGEPTVRPGIERIVQWLANMPGIETLGMTTNGTRLREMAPSLRKAGLSATGLNVSLDTLRRERFMEIAGRDVRDDVLDGIEAALEAGFAPVKVNVVVMAGVNDDELDDFVALARERPLKVRFIEYMPFRDNGWEGERVIPSRVILEAIARRYPLTRRVSLPVHATTREYVISGFAGTVSFVAAISAGFCQGCNRLRVTADGALKVCLFHPTEVSLRALMRSGASDEELAETIRAALREKPVGHPSAENLGQANHRTMIEIGG